MAARAVASDGPAGDDAFDRLERPAEQDRSGDDRAGRNITGNRQQRAEPSAADWTNMRKNLLVAVNLLPTSCASTMLASAIRRLSSWRATIASIIPRPRTAAPWIAAACCALSADAIAVDATSIRACVAFWFRQASVTRRIAEITAITPIQKCNMNATSRKTGVHGASNIAATTGVPMVWRIASKSRIACAVPAVSRAHHLVEDARRQQCVDAFAGPDEQSLPDHVETGQRKQRDRERQRNEQQGRLAPGRDNPIVDLEHVERRGEVENVDEQAEHRRGDEMPAALMERVCQWPRHLDADQSC